MFTGLVETLGQVVGIKNYGEGIALEVKAEFASGLELGESISVNGVCLSVTEFDENTFKVYAMPETLKLTTLGNLKAGDSLNLERAMRLGDRFGGHIVSGHIDGLAQLVKVSDGEAWKVLRFAAPVDFLKQMVWKGSVAVAGVSLTISALEDNFFEVSLIPITCENTILGELKVGEWVNLELSMLGKYVARQLEAYIARSEAGK